MRFLRGSALLAVVLSLSILGCRRNEATPGRAVEPRPYEKTYERGPVDIQVRVDATRLLVAGSMTLSVEATVEDGYTVSMPQLAGLSGNFAVVDLGDDQPLLSDQGSKILRRWAILEPYLSGTYDLPSLMVGFSGDDAAPHTLTTDPVPVEVLSLLPEDYENLEIEDIYPVVYPPRHIPRWTAFLAPVVVVAGGYFAHRKWRRRKSASPQGDPPHVVAYRELERLQTDDLIAAGQVKLFYQRITGILRHYIEDRFGVRAPELTTEEFLREVQRGSLIESELAQMLQRFLEHCDLVKFAELEPEDRDIDSTYSSCRRFVRATEPEGDSRAL